MSQIKPFRGIRPRPDQAPAIAAPPYDVVDYEEGRAYVEDKPHSFLRVEKSEIELPEGAAAEDIFANGAKNLQAFLDQGMMIRDEAPCLYLYQQKMGDHVQVGLVLGASVVEYNEGKIKTHEHTRQDKELERTLHVDTIGANTGPVFLTYRAVADIDALAAKICARTPDVDFVSEDDVGHTLWVVSDAGEVQQLVDLFATQVPHLYVADGHHRSAAASNVLKRRMERGMGAGGDEPYDHFLVVVFPHDQMMIMEYNRVVMDFNGHTPEALRQAVAEKFDIAETDVARPDAPKSFGMYLEGKWYRLTAKEGTYPADDAVQSLDVAVLQNNLLDPLLGIKDPRTDTRIQFVGGIRGTAELEKRAEKHGGVGFALYPTSIVQLMGVADAGEVMPPKSTWFEPKLRSGMVVKSINED